MTRFLDRQNKIFLMSRLFIFTNLTTDIWHTLEKIEMLYTFKPPDPVCLIRIKTLSQELLRNDMLFLSDSMYVLYIYFITW